MLLVIQVMTMKMEFLFREKYLLQFRYDELTLLFTSGVMNLQDYKMFIEYYECEMTKQLFTVNLN